MSQAQASPSAHGLGYRNVAGKWGWFVTLGVVLIVAGVLALGDVVWFTLFSVIFIGAMMLVGGIFQIIHAFMTKAWSDFFLNLVMGILYVIGGLVIMDNPVQAIFWLTLFLVAALLVGGIMRIVVGIRHREMAAWWLLVISGLISVALAIFLYRSFPGSALWILGTVIAVELLIQGFTWLRFGFELRTLARQAR
jgi:uncharacterized membrane protein HdeD (DUF308 family)